MIDAKIEVDNENKRCLVMGISSSSGEPVTREIKTKAQYSYYKWQLPKMLELNPNAFKLKEEKYAKLLDKTAKALYNEYGCDGWLNNYESIPDFLKDDLKEIAEETRKEISHSIKCPSCESTNVHSKGRFSWICLSCGKIFKKKCLTNF